MCDRRQVLTGIAATVATRPTNLHVVTGHLRGYITGRPCAATLVFADGSPSLTFAEAAATTVGWWTNPNTGAVQTIKKLRSGDWTIFFRPEADGSRHEIVFEFGTLFGSWRNLGAYTCTINGWGSEPIVINVPQHWWRARWRWQSAVRPFTAHINQLLSTKKIPPFGNTNIPSSAYTWRQQPYSPMGTAGVYQAMGSTGERPDIGVVTEHVARACLSLLGLPGGVAAAVQTMRDQAEASASVPWHFRDESTGLPIDFNANPTYNNYYTQVGRPGFIAPAAGQDGSGWKPDSGHMPSLSYIPYLLTGDLFHLEELQFVHTWDMIVTTYDRNPATGAQLTVEQERGYAWAFRNLGYCAYLSPDSDTSGCLKNKSYFAGILTNSRNSRIGALVNSTATWQTVFGFINKPINYQSNYWGYSPWQSSFLLSSLCHLIDLGFTDFQAGRDAVLKQQAALANGTSGWDRRRYPYFLLSNEGPGQLATIDDWNHQSTYCERWGPATYQPNTLYLISVPNAAVAGGGAYWNYLRGALRWAEKQGCDVGDSVSYITNALSAWTTSGGVYAKWSFV